MAGDTVKAQFLVEESKLHTLMKKFLIGTKQEMTQLYRNDGTVVPATVLKAGPCTVSQVRSTTTDGYTAVQVSFPVTKKRTARAEFRITEGEYEAGKELDVTTFAVGDIVKVTATSKGRGFAGVVKRHGFHGSPATHGHKDQLRMPGSIGSTGPQRVFKGTRMAGQMGNSRVTVRGLEVMAVRPDSHELVVKGAVPGATAGIVRIESDR